jgi:hypothetical protein
MSHLSEGLARIENHFRVCGIEYAHVFGENGDLLNYFRGTKGNVKFPPGFSLLGKILTHNHPTGGSFSARDLCLILESGLKEIRAYGTDGVYILHRNGNCLRVTLADKFEKALEKMIKKDPEGALEDFATRFGMEYSFCSAPAEFLEKSKLAADRQKRR